MCLVLIFFLVLRRVLRLQAGHKYCLLGRLSSEVGWNHYDTIKVCPFSIYKYGLGNKSFSFSKYNEFWRAFIWQQEVELMKPDIVGMVVLLYLLHLLKHIFHFLNAKLIM